MTERFSPPVLVDMDGVLFDFDGEVRTRLAARHPDIQPLQLDIPAFYTARNYPEEHRDTVWAISNEPGFVASLPLVDSALLGWERILAAGLTPRICSTPLPLEKYPTCIEEKIAALREHFVPHFGHWVIETALFTHDKHLQPGIALIDDKPVPIKHSENATWEHVIFDRDCNRTPASEGYLRLLGWDDPDLSEILKETKRRYLAKMR